MDDGEPNTFVVCHERFILGDHVVGGKCGVHVFLDCVLARVWIFKQV